MKQLPLRTAEIRWWLDVAYTAERKTFKCKKVNQPLTDLVDGLILVYVGW